MGCDSTANLNLTINSTTTSTSIDTACDSYTWNDSTYTQSGIYNYSGSSGVNNYSISFDGIDDYVEIDESQLDNLFKGYNSFTISTWLKRSSEQSANDHLNIFSKGTTPNSEGQNPRGVMILTHVSGDITFILYSAPYDFIYVSEISDLDNF